MFSGGWFVKGERLEEGSLDMGILYLIGDDWAGGGAGVGGDDDAAVKDAAYDGGAGAGGFGKGEALGVEGGIAVVVGKVEAGHEEEWVQRVLLGSEGESEGEVRRSDTDELIRRVDARTEVKLLWMLELELLSSWKIWCRSHVIRYLLLVQAFLIRACGLALACSRREFELQLFLYKCSTSVLASASNCCFSLSSCVWPLVR